MKRVFLIVMVLLATPGFSAPVRVFGSDHRETAIVSGNVRTATEQAVAKDSK